MNYNRVYTVPISVSTILVSIPTILHLRRIRRSIHCSLRSPYLYLYGIINHGQSFVCSPFAIYRCPIAIPHPSILFVCLALNPLFKK